MKIYNFSILYEYTEFYNKFLKAAYEKIEKEDVPVIKCSSCHNRTFDIENEICLVCSHEEHVLECKQCGAPYIYSSCEYDEAAKLCPDCEWKDGYAAANFEKY